MSRCKWRDGHLSLYGQGMRARWPVLVVAGLLVFAVPSPAVPAAGKARATKGVRAKVARGTLTITGNRKANTMQLRLKRHRARIVEVDVGKAGKAEFSFKRRAFKRIVVRGGGGRDTLGISERNGSFFRSERTTLDGGRGTDRLVFTGSRRADSISVSRQRRRLRIARGAAGAARSTAASSTVSARRLERLTVAPLGGVDTIRLGDLTRTGVRGASLQLGSAGRGDGASDTVVTGATAGPDSLSMVAAGSSRTLTGLGWAVSASNVEDSDRFVAVGGGGPDMLTLTGTDGADNLGVGAVDGLMRGVVNGGALYSDEVEAVRLNALGGADSLAVDDLGSSNLGPTDVSQVAVDLGGTPAAGGDGAADAVSVNGGPGAENLVASGGPTGIIVAGGAAVVSVAAPEAGDQLTVNGGGGPDVVSTGGVPAGVIGLTLRGGPDGDTLTGGPADEAFALLPGDGSDVADGGAGTDRAEVGGSDAADSLSAAAPVAGRALFSGPDAALDTNDVETAALAPGGGPDAIVVGDMAGSDLTDIEARLAAPGGAGDGGADTVTVNGTDADEAVTSPAAGVVVEGLAVKMTVTGAEPASDRLVVAARGGSGGDVVDASSLPANRIGLVVEGGLGNDVVIGSPGDDLVRGQDGDDVFLMGAGDDVAEWIPGDDNDTLEGQGGTDRLVMTGNGTNEGFDLSPNGGRLRLFRNVASVVLDANDVELVTLHTGAGGDNVDVNNLAGTDVTRVDVDLAGASGFGDGQHDTVTQLGTNGADLVTVDGGPDRVTTAGLATAVSVTGADTIDDLVVYTVNTGDLIDASGVKSGAVKLTLNGGGGNDSITGGDGDDFLIGGPDDDVMRGGPGLDTADTSEGTDTFFQD
jgi:RTX calcium-binding nonapeptide repeat (4 copies)